MSKQNYNHVCEGCGTEFVSSSKKHKFCSKECKQKYFLNVSRERRIKNLLESGTEGVDYVIDLWNNLPTPRIYGMWMKNMHPGKTTDDYRKDFPDAPLYCSNDYHNTSKNSGKFMREEKYRKMYSEKFKGENNPNHHTNTTEQERKERSPFSLEFYKSRNIDENERENIIEQVKTSKRERHTNVTSIDYYLNKGMNRRDAMNALSERQRTFTLEKCIEKYGEELGTAKYNERQSKWQQKMSEKYKRGEYSKIPYNLIQNFVSNKELSLCMLLMKELNISIDDVKCGIEPSTQLELFSEFYGRRFLYDFNYKNKIIEFNGNFWHANPRKYKPGEIVHSEKPADYFWEKDREKKETAINYNYEIMEVWEDEYDSDPNGVIKRCKEFLLK